MAGIAGVADEATEAAAAALRRGGGDAANAAQRSGVFGALGAGIKRTVIVAAAGAGITATAAGGYYGFLAASGLSHDEIIAKIADTPGDFSEYLNEQFGEAQARAGAEIGAETFYATLEQIGIFFHNIGFKNLGFINWAREAQDHQEPFVEVNGKLVLTSEVATSSDATSSDATNSNTTTTIASNFNGQNVETTLTSIIEQSQEFENYSDGIAHAEGYSAGSGLSPEQLTHAGMINSTIQNFNASKLIDAVELRIGDNPELRARIGTLDSAENIADFQAIQATGLPGLSTLFSSMAEGLEAGPALVAAKSALGLTSPAPAGQ